MLKSGSAWRWLKMKIVKTWLVSNLLNCWNRENCTMMNMTSLINNYTDPNSNTHRCESFVFGIIAWSSMTMIHNLSLAVCIKGDTQIRPTIIPLTKLAQWSLVIATKKKVIITQLQIFFLLQVPLSSSEDKVMHENTIQHIFC